MYSIITIIRTIIGYKTNYKYNSVKHFSVHFVFRLRINTSHLSFKENYKELYLIAIFFLT